MKIKLKRNELILVAIAGLLLLAIIVQKAILQPMMSKIRKENEAIAIKEEQFAKMLRISASKNIIEKKFKEFESLIKVSGKEEEKLAMAMRKIEEIAKQSGISLQDVKPEKTVKLPLGGKRTMIRIIIASNQQNLLKFVYLLESCNLAFSLTELDMKVKTDSLGLLDIDAAVSFIYFVK